MSVLRIKLATAHAKVKRYLYNERLIMENIMVFESQPSKANKEAFLQVRLHRIFCASQVVTSTLNLQK